MCHPDSDGRAGAFEEYICNQELLTHGCIPVHIKKVAISNRVKLNISTTDELVMDYNISNKNEAANQHLTCINCANWHLLCHFHGESSKFS